MGRFAGKTVVVTGSGKQAGLGQGILRAFAAEQANCIVSDLAIDAEAISVVDDLRERGADVATVACDVSQPDQCEALVAQAVKRFGGVDILINNAGIGFKMKPLLDVQIAADWDAVMAVNLSGAFYCTQAAARGMVERGKGGRIINIASQAAKSGFTHLVAYVASKHGMIGLTRASAVELGRHAITVNAVCPNHVTTSLGATQNEYFSKLQGYATVEEYLANMSARNPIGRPGRPSDTAAACLWFASEDACYVTGEALNVSGGEEMH